MNISLILLVLSASVVAAPPPPVTPVKVQASTPALVSSKEALFRIPIPKRETWVWNLGSPGRQEYGWGVQVDVPGGARWLGVQVWHDQGGAPSKGPLAALVASGDVGVWPASEVDGPLLKGMLVTAEVQGTVLVLRVTDPGTLKALFSSRPATVRFVSHRGHGPLPDQHFTSERSQIIGLVYRD